MKIKTNLFLSMFLAGVMILASPMAVFAENNSSYGDTFVSVLKEKGAENVPAKYSKY